MLFFLSKAKKIINLYKDKTKNFQKEMIFFLS